MKKNIPLSVLILITLFSCQQEKSTPTSKQIPYQMIMNITVPAGQIPTSDVWNGFFESEKYLPLIGNLGQIIEIEGADNSEGLAIFVIGKRVKTGTRLKVNTIGKLEINKEKFHKSLTIAVPVASQYQIISPKDFIDFSIRYPNYKKAITQYFKGYGYKANCKAIWGNATNLTKQ